ncbi:MAG: ATPase, T2SS/T4P/T4SS family [Armatimonadota bacterium]|nr:ATPase, T2SS/T4P/T4SS family [Armatimonadota bacterium]MDW8104047.1 ATPase, T2SS/T4P/T4SS family [Armatimonadota bacterium]MDW8290455.1 ATPase, T2SS/T4P/T4SS family [Armatimonadota bacterium]
MATVRKSLGEYLVERGYVTREQLEQAQKIQRSSGGDLGRILVDNQWATMAQVAEARAQELGVPYVDLNTTTIDPSAVNVVPERIARQHKVVPILKDGNVLHVAMADINNVLAFDDLRLVSRCTIRPVLAAPDAIEEAINRAYQSVVGKPAEQEAPAAASAGGGIMQMIKMDIAQVGVGVDVDEEDVESAVRVAEEAPIVRIANTLIQQAIKERASDIHVEPQERGLRIRYRIDGVLHEIMTLPKYIQAPLISRYKIMAEMNIAERRLPQDGRIPVRVEGKDYDLRVSSIPVHLSSGMGEKIVMRILDKTSILIGLDKLGFTPEVQAQLEELVVQPNGMVLSTGPTGSGKTTTQYSVLHKLNSIEKNIITIEDPVEYQLPGISQVQVNRKAGLSFANALRSFLRQDPDIIMVGEMRDLETAEIAIEASLTGHLVLTTLHTNDAPSAVIRMIDMGVEPYLISATVIGVLAQRLARRLCPHCKEPYEVPASDLRRFGFRPEHPDQMVTLWRGRGCEYCRYTGFRGRIGIFELMRVNDEIAELIVRRAPLADIRDAAKANGMHELREDGLLKVLEGITTPDEVMRVVFTAGH